MALLKTIHGAYKSALAKHPLKVQSIQAGALMCFGDYITQTAIEKKSFDIDRNVRFGSVGLVIAPVLQKWYTLLDRRIEKKGLKPFVLKLALDQLCFAPCLLAGVFSLQNIVQGRSLEETKSRLEDNYFDILKSNYMLWPAVQVVNFAFLPLAYRVVFIQGVAVLWNIYLSWKLNQPNKMNALHSNSQSA